MSEGVCCPNRPNLGCAKDVDRSLWPLAKNGRDLELVYSRCDIEVKTGPVWPPAAAPLARRYISSSVMVSGTQLIPHHNMNTKVWGQVMNLLELSSYWSITFPAMLNPSFLLITKLLSLSRSLSCWVWRPLLLPTALNPTSIDHLRPGWVVKWMYNPNCNRIFVNFTHIEDIAICTSNAQIAH